MLRLVAGFLWLGLVMTGLIAAMYLPLRKIWIPASLFLISGFALFLTQEPLSEENTGNLSVQKTGSRSRRNKARVIEYSTAIGGSATRKRYKLVAKPVRANGKIQLQIL